MHIDKPDINTSLQKFNKSVEYIQEEQKDSIEHLKSFLKKMLKKMLNIEDNKKFDHKVLNAINSLYITLNTSINSYNENILMLVDKVIDLEELTNPNTDNLNNDDNSQIAELKVLMAKMAQKTNPEEDKYLED